LSDRPQDTRASETQRRAAPFRLNLEQQRKRAKELLKAARYGEPDALRRFGADHPHATGSCGTVLSDHLARLSEAQLVVARELGLPSWPRLRAHIQAMDRARESIGRGDVVPDQGLTTLHIRCGSDIESALKEAGFVGDFLEYADPLCQGPVLDEAAWLERRGLRG
jgi:hypothetical protein